MNCVHCEVELGCNNKSGFCARHKDYKLGKKCEVCLRLLLDRAKFTFCNAHRPRHGTHNPMYGKSLLEVWSAKHGLEEAQHREDKWKQKTSLACKEKWQDPHYRELIASTTTGLHRTAEFRIAQRSRAIVQMSDQKQRDIRSNALKASWERGTHSADHVIQNSYGARGYTEGVFYASKVELKRIKFLRTTNVFWKRYAVTDFDWRIRYEWNGSFHTYIPDFVIRHHDGTIIIEEMKYDLKRLSKLELAKLRAAELFLPTVGVIYRITDDPLCVV